MPCTAFMSAQHFPSHHAMGNDFFSGLIDGVFCTAMDNGDILVRNPWTVLHVSLWISAIIGASFVASCHCNLMVK